LDRVKSFVVEWKKGDYKSYKFYKDYMKKKELAFLLVLVAIFVAEAFYALSLRTELARREEQFEQAVVREKEEEVLTPAMIRGR